MFVHKPKLCSAVQIIGATDLNENKVVRGWAGGGGGVDFGGNGTVSPTLHSRLPPLSS